MSPDCPFFLVQNSEIKCHVRTWGPKMPSYFHSIVCKNIDKKPNEIFELFEKLFDKNKGKKNYDSEVFELSREEVLEYISQVREAYIKILK